MSILSKLSSEWSCLLLMNDPYCFLAMRLMFCPMFRSAYRSERFLRSSWSVGAGKGLCFLFLLRRVMGLKASGFLRMGNLEGSYYILITTSSRNNSRTTKYQFFVRSD